MIFDMWSNDIKMPSVFLSSKLADEDGDYDDESSAPNSNQKSNGNQLIAPAFFKLSNYTETVRTGESATLKCDIENFHGKLIQKSEFNVVVEPVFV